MVFIAIRRELAGAEGHFRAYHDIFRARAERGLELLPFYEFFELTMTGHLAGTILSMARVLDRRSDVAGLTWLLRQIKNQRSFPNKAEAIADIERRLEEANALIEKVREIRHKKIAHLARMTDDQSKEFWEEIALNDADVHDLLAVLKGIMDDIEHILWPRGGCGLGCSPSSTRPRDAAGRYGSRSQTDARSTASLLTCWKISGAKPPPVLTRGRQTNRQKTLHLNRPNSRGRRFAQHRSTALHLAAPISSFLPVC